MPKSTKDIFTDFERRLTSGFFTESDFASNVLMHLMRGGSECWRDGISILTDGSRNVLRSHVSQLLETKAPPPYVLFMPHGASEVDDDTISAIRRTVDSVYYPLLKYILTLDHESGSVEADNPHFPGCSIRILPSPDPSHPRSTNPATDERMP